MMRWHFAIVAITCLLGSARAGLPAAAAGAATSGAAEPPFAMTVDTSTPYVQAQVLVTLRLTRRIDHYPIAWFLIEKQPDINQAELIVKPLEFRTSREVVRRKGARYLVTEWRYAVFPQIPSGMAIGPVTLHARTATAAGYTRFKAFRTDAIRLQVRPVPKPFTGAVWLPAKTVQVYQGFNPDQSTVTIGSPLSRRLELTFDGAQKGELPAFTGSSTPGLEVHAFQPRRSEQSTLAGLAATLEQQIVVTPTKAGQLEIPDLEVPWWNTVTDREEIAHFPGYTLTVMPAPAGWGTGGVGPAHRSLSPVAQLQAAVRSVPLSMWVAAIVAVTVVAGGVGLLALAAMRLRGTGSTARPGVWTRLGLKRRALRACAADDPVNAARAILCLARATDPTGGWRSLRQLAVAAAEPLRSELLILNAALFEAGQPPWRGQALRRTLRRSMKFGAERAAGVPRITLPRLYPLASSEPSDAGWKS